MHRVSIYLIDCLFLIRILLDYLKLIPGNRLEVIMCQRLYFDNGRITTDGLPNLVQWHVFEYSDSEKAPQEIRKKKCLSEAGFDI